MSTHDPFAGPAIESVIASSEMQREVWLADQLGPDASCAYNEAVEIRLTGMLAPDQIERALNSVIQAHESLRATVAPDGESLLIAAFEAVSIPFDDLQFLPAEAAQTRLEQARNALVTRHFDLCDGPLWRARLLRHAADQYCLIFCAHHIVCDGWSMAVIFEDLLTACEQQLDPTRPGLAPGQQYGSYISALAAQPEIEDQARKFWSRRHEPLAPYLELPGDRSRPSQRQFDAGFEQCFVAPEDFARFSQAMRSSGVSLFAGLLTGLGALLARISGQADLVVGVPAAGQPLVALERLVGHCISLLPVRITLAPEMSAHHNLHLVANELIDSFEHASLSYGSLLKALDIGRDPARLPLVNVMCNLDQAMVRDPTAQSQVHAEIRSVPRAFENFELFVNAVPVDGGLNLECQYAARLFDARTVQAWLGNLKCLIVALTDMPEQALGKLDAQPAQCSDGLGATRALPGKTLGEILFDRIGLTDMPAIRGAHTLSHRELRACAQSLARTLIAHGIRPGDRIGVQLERDARLPVALLAVIGSGAAYVPLDPGFPADRLAFMAHDAELALLLTSAELPGYGQLPRLNLNEDILIPTHDVQAGPLAETTAQAPAYLIYTSGSTGQPKGVEVPQSAVVNFLASMRHTPGLRASDRLLAVTTLSFDISVLEILLPVLCGASLVLATRDQVMDADALARLIEVHRINVMQATPASWRMLIDAGWSAREPMKALVGGEALPSDLARALSLRCDEVWNLYGPTETTVWSSVWRLDPNVDLIRIGQPIDNTRIWVLDDTGQACGPGMPGEIVIGGAGLATGYWKRPELSAERFANDLKACPGERVYRTGDRGRWLGDGQLLHMGRLDHQIKLRGFRIEPGEIEAALRTLPGVLDAVVLLAEFGPGDKRLIAFLQGTRTAIATSAEIRIALRAKLPEYMLPAHVSILDSFPRLPNGKLNRDALQNLGPDSARLASIPAPSRPAKDGIEQQICDVMAEVLGLPSTNPDANFFALGGHSMLAARFASRLHSVLACPVPLRQVFDHPSPAELARYLSQERRHDNALDGPILAQAAQDVGPLSLMQRRLWFLDSITPGRPVFNTPSAHRLIGSMDIPRLSRALNALIKRQPSLRTCIETRDGRPCQRVLTATEPVQVQVEPVLGADSPAREQALSERLNALASESIALDAPPLFRLHLFQIGPREHVLFFMPHHIIWDGWSFDIFHRELAALYASDGNCAVAGLAPLPVSYLDFSHWQHQWLTSERAARQIQWWCQHLSPLPEPLALTPQRPAIMAGAGRGRWMHVDRSRTNALRSVAQAQQCTLNMFLLASYAALLHELTAQHEHMIGMPVRARDQTVLESLMGFFVNALPLRLSTRVGSSFADLLQITRSEMLAALEHPDLPFEQLVHALNPSRDASRPAVYQAFFSFQDARERQSAWASFEHEPIWIMQPGAVDDISLWFVERADGLHGAFVFNAELIDDDDADRIAARFDALIDSLQADLDQPLCAREGNAASLPGSPDSKPEQASTANELRPTRSPDQREPSTATEQLLASIWRELIGVTRVDRHDNFFDLGGHSLLVIEALARMQSSTGKRIEPRHFVFDTLAQIAHAYDQSEPYQSGAPRAGLFSRLFGRRQ